MRTAVESILKREAEKKKMWQKELSKLPEGSLYCILRGKKTYFYQALGGCRKGITGNDELVYKLARKRYLITMIREQDSVIKDSFLTMLGRKRKGDKKTRDMGRITTRDRLIEYFKRMNMDIARITCTQEQYQWMKEPFLGNQYLPEDLKYRTYSGICVRSKTEQMIANMLETKGIPYRYEQALLLPTVWMEGSSVTDDGTNKIYYPDFIILMPSGRIIIWEHLGRVDLSDYRVHAMEKVSAYRQGAGYDDSQLILTFEKDTESIEELESIIERRIMPFM